MVENQNIFDGISGDSIVLNGDNISECSIQQHSSVITDRNYWHAFLIHNVTNPKRNETLKIILNYVYPEALLPIFFQSRGRDCIFLARNCSGAIFKLLKNNLVIPNPLDPLSTYTCEIILMYSSVSKFSFPPNNISKVLKFLFDDQSRMLNIEKFHDNKELAEYYPLSQPKLLCFVLRISDNMKPACINLKCNEIRTLSPFQVLQGSNSVEKLDLRYNLIEDLEELKYLKFFNLLELWLDGNPLCGKYDATSYIKSIKKILPTLEKLDGVTIGAFGLPKLEQNFLCSNEGFDLVEQFVIHFFSLYDTERKLLVDIYHPSAIFSMTIDTCQDIGDRDRLFVYKNFTRNLLRSNPSDNEAVIGNIRILNTLCELPQTKHNMHTFSVDLIYYSDCSAVLSITGTFCENMKRNQSEFVFGFKRTFTIIRQLSYYVIYNDLLHINEVSKCQSGDALKSHEVKKISSTRRKAEETMVEEAMCRITGVHKTWIKRLLEDADYNIINFLTSFVALVEGNKIPQQAYSQNSQHSLMDWLAPKMLEFGMEKFENYLREETLQYIEANPLLQRKYMNSLVTNISNIEGSQQQIYEQKYGDLNKSTHNIPGKSTSLNIMTSGVPNPCSYNIDKDWINKPQSNSKRTSNLVIIEREEKKEDKIYTQKNAAAHEHENSKKNIQEKFGVYNPPILTFDKERININDKINMPQVGLRRDRDISNEGVNPSSIQIKKLKFSETSLKNQNSYSNIISGGNKKNACKNNSEKVIRESSVVDVLPTLDTSSNLKLEKRREKDKENIIHDKKDYVNEKNNSGCIQRERANFSVYIPENQNSSSNTISAKDNSEKLTKEESYVDIRPSLTLMDNKWLFVKDHEEYDFHQTFNKWTLVFKNKEGKYIPKQDDFQKSFTCWKKHFPTYPDENLSHSLQSSCIKSQLFAVFDTIKYPVTFWDFPATVPEDIRPPKYAILDGITKTITPGGDYGFISMQKKWLLVHLNHLNNWVLLNNEKKIVWKDDKWIIEPLPLEERIAENDEPEDTFVIFDDEDVEIINEEEAKISLQQELEEIKTIYPDDAQPEKTITMLNYSFYMSQNNEQGSEICKADNLTKWRKLYDVVPYYPRLALIEGYWVVVCNQSNLKFHKTHTNSWVLLEKDSESNEWLELKEDFCLNTLSKNIFDHIPMPVTMYDFTSSVPSNWTPTESLVIDGKVVNVTPDSDYAFISIKGQWYPVKKNEKNEWVALNDVHQNIVKKKLTNMPFKFENTVGATVEFKSEDDRKISSVTCTLLQVLIGVKLVKPLTHWDIDGAEEKRPPKIALTEIDGELQWCCVTPSCGKGFVLEENVWVKVVSSESGEWKATRFNAYEGCIIGYYLFNNVWITMKKYIIGGKWSPLFDLETTPTTYWNYIGPEESKPPLKIVVDNMEKIIHNNSNMGFVMKENVWTLMENDNKNWKICTRNQNCFFYKLIHGMWQIVEKDSKGNWSYGSDSQKMVTYQNFNGLKKYAPPKWVFLSKGTKKIKKIIDEKSNMGFILDDGVWVLMAKKNAVLIRLKSSKGHTDIGYKSIDGKFIIVGMAEKDKLIDLEDENIKNYNHYKKLTLIDQIFKNATPLTYDRILLDFPKRLKPPKCAFLKDSIANDFKWILVTISSDYGFIRKDDIWLLMMRTVDNNWKNTNNSYKIIDNSWIPMKNENNSWVPVIDPKKTPKVPDLCIEDPEALLPYKIVRLSGNFENVIDVNPWSGMGYLKISDEYVLMKKMSCEKWVRYVDNSNNVLVLKFKDNGEWEITPIHPFDKAKNYIDSDQTYTSEKKETFSTSKGPRHIRPPQYIKLIEEGVLKWKKICFEDGFAFIKRKYWILVKKIEKKKWVIVNEDEGYNLIDNRWVVMKKSKDQWLPTFDPKLTPRCYMDHNDNSMLPVRVITFKNGHAKYLNTANDCSLGFIINTDNVCILMRETDGKWTAVEDDFIETPSMAFKNIDGKWQRMKKNVLKEKWVPCAKQLELPILHFDVLGQRNEPPHEIVLRNSKNKVIRMDFNIFSNEGFKQITNGIWVLMQPKDSNEWVRYPGIFGSYGYKVKKGKIIENSPMSLIIKDVPILPDYFKIKDNPIQSQNSKVKDIPQQPHNPAIDIPLEPQNSKTKDKSINLLNPIEKDIPKQPNNPAVKDIPLQPQSSRTKENPTQPQNTTIKDIPIQPLTPKMKIKGISMEPEHQKIKYLEDLQNLIIYKNTENWSDGTYPPLAIMIPGWINEENKIEYGFVKDGDVWILKRKIKNTWYFKKSFGQYHAYKLMEDRWIPMKLVSNEWKPTFDPSKTPYNFHNTAGKFEDKPPLRIHLDNKWKITFDNPEIAFNRDDDMWVVMIRTKSGFWKKYQTNGTSIGYKIIDGIWTKFYKYLYLDKWNMCRDAKLPVHSWDFTPGNKKAPPSSLCFGYSLACEKIKQVYLGHNSTKGFISDNGAWVLMTRQDLTWVKFDRFPWLKGSFAYILKNNIWRIVKKDVDGSWKCGSLNKDGEWFYGNKLVQVKKPLDIGEMVKLQSQKVLPKFLLIFYPDSDSMPTKISLTSLTEPQINFQRQDGAWLLLMYNKHKWEILGGMIAYLMIDNRWVTMNLLGSTWVPAYDPITTPITYFESVKPIDFRPPLRIVINERGVDEWKVIFQHSGYGFVKEDDLWVLMKISYDGTWVKHQDHFQELTGYKFVEFKWKRFKKNIEDNWKCNESSLPLLQCDFSILHQELPPPLFHDFLKDPTITCESNESNLSFYSKFGYQKDNNIWVLKECDNNGSWSEHKFFINQTELFGFQSINNIWKLFRKDQTGNWISGQLLYSDNNGWKFIEAITKQQEPKKLSLNMEGIKAKKKQKPKYKKQNKSKMEEEIENNEQNEKEIIIRNEGVREKGIEDKTQDENVPKILDDRTNEIEECNEQGNTIKQNEGGVQINCNEQGHTIEQNEGGVQIKVEAFCLNLGDKQEGEKRVEQNVVISSEQKSRKEKEDQIKNVQLEENEAEQAEGIAISQVIECKNDEDEPKNKQVKQNIVHSTVRTSIDKNDEKVINITKQTNSDEISMNCKIENEEINKFEIAITNPVKYHELSGLSVGEKPPKSVCLNIRGVPRRVPLVSKSSKIGFQHHNGVWVLLERLSGDWKILHNSAGIPLAYKLMDNRWVSMRISRSGSWISTFNPSTTPRTFFDTEGPDDMKPPRRVVINENGILKWKEISEFSNFGFLKKDDMWVLMQKSPNTKWVEYMTIERELCAFKMQDSKWTKFTKKTDDTSWKIIVENLPVLHYDFAFESKAAPPVITNYLLKKNKLETTNVGFSWNDGAWVFMEREESDNWTAARSTCGFARTTGEFWNLLEKDESWQWKTVESNCEFELIFERTFQPHVKRKREVIACPPNKKLKTSQSESSSEGVTEVKIYQTSSIENELDNPVQHRENVETFVQGQKETESCSTEVSTTDEPATKIEHESGKLHSEAKGQKITPNKEGLNDVERYLALNSDCCVGCPELQNLLRNHRPSNVPNKILRKKFRLPDGGSRILSIPKYIPSKPKEDDQNIEEAYKRGPDSEEDSVAKRIKCQQL
ncbi:uncharacterized protein LOC123672475 isoform X2 [Harmonia axyridis]|uniref:uncharacterized protein LOC123672475 isoform X2 n=1 Tax=Harmonia axyridis TaxID=115357 RepID=UPI001E277F89|nr:uncharacterized protein LOC123672475 isoform X2 [Harmonia axyridis]